MTSSSKHLNSYGQSAPFPFVFLALLAFQIQQPILHVVRQIQEEMSIVFFTAFEMNWQATLVKRIGRIEILGRLDGIIVLGDVAVSARLEVVEPAAESAVITVKATL